MKANTDPRLIGAFNPSSRADSLMPKTVRHRDPCKTQNYLDHITDARHRQRCHIFAQPQRSCEIVEVIGNGKKRDRHK
jgi:hypothetical protein